MGVIRPPWISKAWFSKCPFNYCDHFGDKEILATVCKICKDELMRNRLYQNAGKNPYAIENVFDDVVQNFQQAIHMIEKDAERLGIDLDNLPEIEDEEPPSPEKRPLYNVLQGYRKQIQKTIQELQIIPSAADQALVEKTVDVLDHSQLYMIVKIARALHSRLEEKDDPIMQELADSKTSTFFAYIAVKRNGAALLALSKHKPLHTRREVYLKLAAISMEVAAMIQEEFFPDEKLIYEEFGYQGFENS